MKNKDYITLLLILFLLALLTIILSFTTSISAWTLSLFQGFAFLGIDIFGLIFLIRNGTFRKTIFLKITIGFLALTALGILFKIMHWPGTKLCLTIGLIGIIITYAIHFSKKITKKRQDILRLIWVLSSSIISWTILMHIFQGNFTHISNSILYITIADFAYYCYRGDKLMLDK